MKLLRSFSGREKYQQTLQTSWLPGLAGFCSIFTLGFLFLYFQKPIDEASAQLELPENKPSYSASAITSKTLQQRIARAQGQINNITSQTAYIKAKLNVNSEEVGVATIVNKSSQVQELVQQLKKLESQLAQDRSRFKISNKRILKLQEEINHAKQLLRNKIQDIVDFQEKKILESSQLAQIEQELAVKLVTLEASNIGLLREIHHLSNIQVLSYGTHADRPISNYFIAYFGLAALGLLVILVIVVAVYLLEVFDKSPKTITETQKIFDINYKASILGSIAHETLLVVRPGILEQKQANLTREILQNSEQNILGMVFNDISHNLESYNDFYRALEEKTQIAPETNSLKKSSVELWETITHVSSESYQNHPNSKLNIKKLKDIDRDELEAIIINLQQNLDTSTQLVQEQEDELFMKRQDVRKLQRKVNIANNSERYTLENQLQQEQELKNMLNETLIGQRHNLNKKIKILLQYRQLLTEKQYD